VALIGHATIFECINSEAVQSFAEISSRNTPHLIMCEEGFGNKFRADYFAMGQTIRLTQRELLFELRWPLPTSNNNYQLRLATGSDIEVLEPVHAGMALNESGVDPRVVDSNGFRERYLRRIRQGRTWILMEGNQLIFKADVVTETAHASYIEGIWVNPDYRRKGYGRNCMSQLARMLLWRSRSLCLFVNDENKEAQSFYRLCGYHPRAAYDAMFLQ
jgi:predicted GNAT family acetyltransferase